MRVRARYIEVGPGRVQQSKSGDPDITRRCLAHVEHDCRAKCKHNSVKLTR